MVNFKYRLLIPFLISLLSFLLTFGCSFTSRMGGSNITGSNSIKLTVSAATSLQDALEAIAVEFHQIQTQAAVSYNFASSGALQQQLEQGAPVDIFVAAAAQQMDALVAKGVVDPSSRRNLLTNQLVLIAPLQSSLNIQDWSALKMMPIKRLAVGEFRTVPAGQYAEQALKSLDLLDALRSSFVFGNSVRSVLAAVESGNAEVGIVYATDAEISQRVKVLAIAPANSHEPIVYSIAILKQSQHPATAAEFIQFLTTDPAQNIFKKFGFSPA